MNATPRDHAVWQNGFVAGQEDMGAIILAALIEDGREWVSLNELRDYIQIATDVEDDYLPEYILELLNQIRDEHHLNP